MFDVNCLETEEYGIREYLSNNLTVVWMFVGSLVYTPTTVMTSDIKCSKKQKHNFLSAETGFSLMVMIAQQLI